MSEMDEVIKDFLIESAENLDRLDREFVELERSPGSRELLASIFRTIHTIKGTCGFFGFQRLEKVAHAGESLLAQLRDGKRVMTPACAEALLATVDAIRAMLAHIEAGQGDGEEAYPELVARLGRLAAGEEAPAPSPAPPPLSPTPDPEPPRNTEPPAPPEASRPEPEAVERGPAEAPEREPVERSAAPSAADSTVRVDIAILDQLMTLVGELVLARNQAVTAARSADSQVQAAWQRIDHVTGALQEAVMRTRMLPLGNLFNRYPRIVRDLATQCGKKVRLEIEGADTGLDRTLLEAIKDPLTHIVRNAIDHGFESPEARLAAGKPAEGRLLLRAFHEGGRVTVEVADDGGGIHREKVKDRAIQRGLLSPGQAAAMSDREALDIIFMPGFSTAEKVTALSGRGVGMDVVRTNIAALGGTVDLESTEGHGTRLQMRVPLTLAIVPALIVLGGGERFALPQVSVQEIIRLPDDGSSLESIHGVPVYRLRERLIPLLRLDGELQLPSQYVGRRSIVILTVGRNPFGLVVDSVADRMDIVVKPVAHGVGKGLFSGATVLGDGSVSLILDVAGMAERAQLKVRESEAIRVKDSGRVQAVEAETLVLLRSPDDGRMVVPLAKITRIEEIPLHFIERDGDGEVLQYRGHILPILRLAQVMPERRKIFRNPEVVERDRQATRGHVLVHDGPRGSVGLVVPEVLDILSATITETRPSVRFGAKFSAVIRDRVTEMLDLEVVVRKHIPDFYKPAAKAAS